MEHFKNIVRLYSKLPTEIYVLCICMMINGLGNFVFPLITFILKLKIGFSEVQIGFFITLFIVCQAPCLLISGKIIDYFGRKRLFFWAYMLGASGYIICSLIELSITTVILIFVASILFSISGPVFNTLITDLTNTNNRKESFSLMYLANNIGFSISPLLAGLLFLNYLKVLFIINALSMILSIIIFSLFIKDCHSQSEKDNLLDDDQENMEFSKEKTISILFKNPLLIVTAVVMFVYQFGYSQWGFLLPLQLVEEFSTVGTTFYGVIAFVNGFTVILLTPFLTYQLRKISAIKLLIYGGGCYAISFIMFGIAHTLGLFILSIIIMTVGEILIVMNYNVFIANNTPKSHRGRVLSLLPIITGLGYALGPVVVGKLTYLGYTPIWIFLGVIVLGAAIGMHLLASKKVQQKYKI